VYEFTFVASDGTPAGYVLISGTRDRGPIFDFCFEGTPPSSMLHKSLLFLTELLHVSLEKTRWYYFGPFDFMAESRLTDGRYLYARVPNFQWVFSSVRLSINRKVVISDYARRRWQYYLDPSYYPFPPLWECKVLNWYVPIRYNQVCQGDVVRPVPATGNYCRPN